MDKYCSGTRDRLEGRINDARHKLYKLKEERYDMARLNVEVEAKNIVLECENYKFGYGDNYGFCNEPGHDDDCGCATQDAAFIGFKAQNGPAHGYYAFFSDSCREYKGMDRYKMFLILVAKALNFDHFRKDIEPFE